MFTPHCPRCRSIDYRGVGVRNVVEHVLHWILLPQRCTLCGNHFFLFRWWAVLGGAV